MPVTDITKELDANKLTVTAQFAAPADRVWELWADPRQLERWWGPPSHPATVTQHDLEAGGEVQYYMTGPEGDRFYGLWRVEEVAGPDRLRFQDRFADENGQPNDDMPASNATVTIAEADGTTTMTVEWTYASREALEKILEMGAEQGMREALGQIDAVLA